MPARNISVDLTKVSATQTQPLGFEFEFEHRAYGLQTWIYVYNTESTARVAGTVFSHAGGDTPGNVERVGINKAAGRVVGVAQHDLPANHYGWIQKRGFGARVYADVGGLSADFTIVVGSSSPGSADNAAAVTDESFGLVTTGAAAGELALCKLWCK